MSMDRPLASVRPFGPVLEFGDQKYSEQRRQTSYTILMGMRSGSAPSMSGFDQQFNNSVQSELRLQSDELDRSSTFDVINESIVAKEIEHSLWMTVIKLYDEDIDDSEAKQVASDAEDALSTLGYDVADKAVFKYDYFSSKHAIQI